MGNVFRITGVILLYILSGVLLLVVFAGLLLVTYGGLAGYPAALITCIIAAFLFRYILKNSESITGTVLRFIPATIALFVVMWSLVPLPQHDFEDAGNEKFETWDLGEGRIISVSRHQPPSDVPIREETMVFVHGGPGVFVRDFDRDFFSGFTDDGFQVIMYDQVGAGRSSIIDITEYSHQGNVNDLKKVLDIIDGPIILVGQSYGTGLITSYLGEHQGRHDIRQIILTEPSPLPGVDLSSNHPHFAEKTTKAEHAEGLVISDVIKSPRIILGLMLPAGNRFVDQNELLHYLGPDDQKAAVAISYCEEQSDNMLSFQHLPVNLRATLLIRNSFTKAKRPDLRNLDIPVLLLLGECSYVPRGFAMEYFEHYDISRSHLLRDVGHVLWTSKEGRQLTYDAIMSFVDGKEMPLPNEPNYETRIEFIEAGW